MSYLIKTVASMTGIPKNTLIAWERRHGVVVPNRTDSGYRRYSDEDVRTLLRIKELIAAGYRISEAAHIVQAEPLPPMEEITPQGLDGDAVDHLRNAMETCLLAFDRAGADRLAQKLMDMPFERRLERVYLPMMRNVGHGWEVGEITIAQEHFATAWTREQLISMMRALGGDRPDAKEVVAATPQGDRHEFGLLSISIRLALRGWSVIYLGTDLPAEEVASVVNERGPQLLAVSVVLERPSEVVQAWLEEVRTRIGDRVNILVGGRGANDLSKLPTLTTLASSLRDDDTDSLDAFLRNL